MHSTLTREHFATHSELLNSLCLYYIGWLLRRHENHLGLSFCSHINTVVAARFL